MVWIRFPKLNLVFYDESFLLDLAATAVKVDTNTLKVERGRFARICVEIDLTKSMDARDGLCKLDIGIKSNKKCYILCVHHVVVMAIIPEIAPQHLGIILLHIMGASSACYPLVLIILISLWIKVFLLDEKRIRRFKSPYVLSSCVSIINTF